MSHFLGGKYLHTDLKKKTYTLRFNEKDEREEKSGWELKKYSSIVPRFYKRHIDI